MMSKLDEVLGAISGKNRRNAAKKAAAGLGAGLALGALAGLLFAPKPGKETREDIAHAAEKGAKIVKQKAGEGAQYVSEAAQDVAQMAKEKASVLKSKIKVGAEKVASEVDSVVHRAKAKDADIEKEETDAPKAEAEAASTYEDPPVETAEFNRP